MSIIMGKPLTYSVLLIVVTDMQENFADAYNKMWNSESSGQYLFFPVKSRYTFNGSAAGSAQSLQDKCDEICLQDLDLDRIWPTFGTKKHSSYVGSQFVIGM
jgi:hypothetical protein